MRFDIKKLGFINFATAVVLVSAIEVSLILAGAVSPLSELSAANAFFSFLTLAILYSMGWRFSDDKLNESARKGAVSMFAAFLVVIVGVFIGRSVQKPVLGVYAPSESALYMLLLVNLLVNVVIGAIIVSAGAFFARMMKKQAKKRAKK